MRGCERGECWGRVRGCERVSVIFLPKLVFAITVERRSCLDRIGVAHLATAQAERIVHSFPHLARGVDEEERPGNSFADRWFIRRVMESVYDHPLSDRLLWGA